jgi:hypothetical protein
MNGWLGPVSLRLAGRGYSLGGLRAPAQDIRQHSAFLGQARLRPSYDLGRPVQHLGQEPKCCNAPDGSTLCFDEATGECQNTWNSGSPTPGAPACVLDASGHWTHPDCWTPPPPPVQMAGPGRVRRIPLLNLNFGPMLGRGPNLGQANCCNRTMPDGTVWLECLDPLWRTPNADYRFPMCGEPGGSGTQPPVGGGGGTAPGGGGGTAPGGGGGTAPDGGGAAPGDGGTTPDGTFPVVNGDGKAPGGGGAPTPTPSPDTTCPEGQVLNNEDKCVPGNFSACRNGDGSWRLFKHDGDVDPLNDVYYGSAPNAYANGVNYPEGVVASIADANGLYCQEHPVPTQAPVSAPEPTPGPIPASGIPVLPPPQATTIESPPTGAWPGQPFSVAPRNQPVPMAKAPAPLPPACPLGPVPLRRWVEGCMGS